MLLGRRKAIALYVKKYEVYDIARFKEKYLHLFHGMQISVVTEYASLI